MTPTIQDRIEAEVRQYFEEQDYQKLREWEIAERTAAVVMSSLLEYVLNKGWSKQEAADFVAGLFGKEEGE